MYSKPQRRTLVYLAHQIDGCRTERHVMRLPAPRRIARPEPPLVRWFRERFLGGVAVARSDGRGDVC